jgi:hypothetical protein
LITGVLLALAPSHAFAASGTVATQTGTTTATIVAPLTLQHTPGAVLNFGTMVVGAGGGDIILTTLGAGIAIGNVALVPSGPTSADKFSVAGDPNRNYSVTTGSGYVVAGSSSMLFATSPAANQATLGATGTGTISVGGSLQVGAGIAPGIYTGTYTVTIAYD